MAEQEPTAPAPEQSQETGVADTPTNTNTEQVSAPEQKTVDLGLSPEQAERFKTFMDNHGGFDTAFKKLKTDVSTPEPEKPSEPKVEEPKAQEPTSPQPPVQPVPPTPPAGAITTDEMMTKYYFEQLSKNEAYAPIAKEIADGSLLKEMNALGIDIRNADGSFNDAKINTYLGIKAQTVPAQQTSTEPEASSAPTVEYKDVGEIKTMEQARTVIMQPGHPQRQQAEEFMKKFLNPNSTQDK